MGAESSTRVGGASINRGQIRNLTREYLNEPFPSFWTDASLNLWIDVAVPKVHNRIKQVSRYHFTTRATFPTVVGTEFYALPTDCKDVKLITRFNSDGRELPLTLAPWPDPTAFTPTSFLDPTAGHGDEGPSYYWMVGASIRLLPRPQAIVTMKLYYEARLTPLSDDNAIPTFDADYHDMAAKWAAIEAGVKDNQQLKNVLVLYDKREEDMIQDVLHRVPAPAQETESFLGE